MTLIFHKSDVAYNPNPLSKMILGMNPFNGVVYECGPWHIIVGRHKGQRFYTIKLKEEGGFTCMTHFKDEVAKWFSCEFFCANYSHSGKAVDVDISRLP